MQRHISGNYNRRFLWPCSKATLILWPMLCFFLLSGTGYSDVLYVNRSFHWLQYNKDKGIFKPGSNPNAKGTALNPYQTVAEAVAAAKPGDEIKVLDAYYPEKVVVNKRVAITAPSGTVTIGEDRENAQPGALIKPEDATFIVDNKDSLLTALDQAKPGEIIYITSYAGIDLTGEEDIQIPAGVTLASSGGNGLNRGAFLYTNEKDFEYETVYRPPFNTPVQVKKAIPYWLFKISGSDVRVTGIRFRGPSTVVEDGAYAGCIRIRGPYKNIEIDHNEFYGWPIAAVEIRTILPGDVP